MSIISLSTYTDMSGAATPSSGIIIGLDTLDGKLKQKGTSGTVTEIGSGGGGSAGTSGSSGSSGSSGTSGTTGSTGLSGADGGNSLKWIYGDHNVNGEFELASPDFTQTNNQILINYFSQVGDTLSWLTALADYNNLFHDAVYMKISELSDPNIYGIYKITGNSDQTTFWRFTCTMVSSNGTPTNGLEYSISWVIMGGNSGSSGTSGSSGSSGTSGSSGSSGTRGSSGTSGSSGLSGSVNMKGIINSATPFALPLDTSPSTTAEYYGVDSTMNATTITLPDTSSISDGKVVHIKDEKGNATTYSITIASFNYPSQSIDGLTSFSISNSWGSVSFIKNGTDWFILSKVV